MVASLLSFWEGNFSGAMLNFGRVVDSSRLVQSRSILDTFKYGIIDEFEWCHVMSPPSNTSFVKGNFSP